MNNEKAEMRADSKARETHRGRNWLLRLGCGFVVIAAALHSADRPVGGGDTWVAMACGRYTAGPWAAEQPDRTWQMRVLDRVGIHITKRDFFSGKSRPFEPGSKDNFGWVNQNWLTHLMFYKMKTAWGESGPDALKGENLIVAYKFLQAILTALFAYWAARKLGAHPVIAAAITAFGMLLSRSYIDMRPNITSIFLAAIMIYLLARWKQGQWKSLAWMIPVMIVWSNVHGGFIYAIMIFAIMSGSHLAQKFFSRNWPKYFEDIPARGILYLLAATAIVIVIPAVFSPFGIENLTHPFIVATGEEGKLWREVQEWRPVYDKHGFGNVTPFFVYIGLLGCSFLLWCISFLLGPDRGSSRQRRSKGNDETLVLCPKIDLASLAVIAVTLYMSIQSRRFVFLGGVILAPYLAKMIQDSIVPLRIWRGGTVSDRGLLPKDNLSSRTFWEKPLTGISWATGLAITAIFVLAIRDIYFAPPPEGMRMSVFRRMVGIKDQPIQATEFLNANRLSGLVFNEWNTGGFIAYQQDPDPQSGQPLCKVYMDGRAQAAYTLEHYQRWIQMRNPAGACDPKAGQYLQALLSRFNLSQDDPQRFQKLIDHYKNDPATYRQLILLSMAEPTLYSLMMKNDGVSAVLLYKAKTQDRFVYDLLMKSGQWEDVYIDNRFGLLLRTDDPRNQTFVRMPIDQRQYPDDFSRQFMTGYFYAMSSTAPQDIAKGLEILLQLKPQHHWPDLYVAVYLAGRRLGRLPEIQAWFLDRQKYFKDRIDSGDPFGRLDSFQSLIQTTQILYAIAKERNDAASTVNYQRQVEDYKKQVDDYMKDDVKEGWLW
jgi:hypothetical protein